MFGKVFLYISFALEVGGVVEAIAMMVAAKQPLTGVQVQQAVGPALGGLTAIWPKAVFPPQLVVDICATTADAINKYVLKLP